MRKKILKNNEENRGLTHWLKLYGEARADQLALVFGKMRFNWSEFEDRVSRLASVLRQFGVGQNERVAMLAQSSNRYVEYFYASLWAGGVIVPLNNRLALPELIEQFRDSEPVVLIVDESFSSQAEALVMAVPSLRRVLFAGDGPSPAGMVDYEAAIRAAVWGATIILSGITTIILAGGEESKAA